MKFNSYDFVVELEKACGDIDTHSSCARSYGKMCGFFTSALTRLDLNEEQVATLTRMLEIAQRAN